MTSSAVMDELGTTRYVRSGDGHIAYQVLSSGPTDILLLNESVLPIEALQDNIHTSSYLQRLAAWGRVILFDRRGVGLSDPITSGDPLTLQDWVADAVAVLDAVGSSSAVVFSSGPSAGLIALQLAANFPERVTFLSLYDAIARYRWAHDYPWGVTSEDDRHIDEQLRNDWGTPRLADRRGRFAATAARHEGFVDWAITWFRRGTGPAGLAAQTAVVRSSDVRDRLPLITCPTLVVNHVGVGDGRYLSAHIADARYVELHDPCHLLFSSELDAVMAITSELVNGTPLEPSTRRVLTTILFTDIVDSTAAVATVGDRRWGIELELHFAMVRRHIRHFDGREIKTLGDGVVATFDGPTRAVQCALAIGADARRRGVTVRAGVHTGEVELRRRDVVGLSVHVAHRVCALAAGDQVLVTERVVDLAAGSELHFDPVGAEPLRGMEGRWEMFEASSPHLSSGPGLP